MDACDYTTTVGTCAHPTDPCPAIARLAILSLYKEATLYPKPGLVSPIDAGSHTDMNYQLFLASINSLRKYFFDIAALGIQCATFEDLQQRGIEAEQVMMCATGGINTHRGAIFNLGLICAAAGHLYAHNLSVSAKKLGQTISEQWGMNIRSKALTQSSHGQKVARRYGIHGACHEAVEGYPTVIQFGLPAYNATFTATQCHERASVQALFAIMRNLNDTNILWRAGISGLDYVQSTASQFLESGGTLAEGWKERVIALHRDFVQRKISPGGAADLLGATLLMHTLSY